MHKKSNSLLFLCYEDFAWYFAFRNGVGFPVDLCKVRILFCLRHLHGLAYRTSCAVLGTLPTAPRSEQQAQPEPSKCVLNTPSQLRMHAPCCLRKCLLVAETAESLVSGYYSTDWDFFLIFGETFNWCHDISHKWETKGQGSCRSFRRTTSCVPCRYLAGRFSSVIRSDLTLQIPTFHWFCEHFAGRLSCP